MHIKTPADVGALMRERRNQLGLDQATLAKSVGVSRKWIVEVEGGKPGVALGLVLRTLRVLNVSLQSSSDAATPARPRKPVSNLKASDLDDLIDSLKRSDG